MLFVTDLIATVVCNAVLKGFEKAFSKLGIKDDADDPLTAIESRMAALPAPSTNGEDKPARSRK